MTQETLALALARTSQPDVASWEAGNVKIPASKAEAILEILEIDLEIMARDLMRPWDEVLLDIHGIAV
jgi:predicted transcriptional regulator